jgi:hypothetical protein
MGVFEDVKNNADEEAKKFAEKQKAKAADDNASDDDTEASS